MPDRLDRLKAHADELEAQMQDAAGSAFASLSRQYMDALRQIDEIESRSAGTASAVDEIAQRRARRKPIRNGESREA